MAGWIKISREIANHWLWQDAERLKWWIDILFMAAWKDRKQLVGKQFVALRRGQFIASLSFLCKRWGRSRSMVEPFLNLLQEEEMISKEVGNNISIITVLNYDKYQANNSTESDAEVSTEVDAHLDAPKKSCKSDKYDSPDAHPDAHLDAPKKSCKSDKYDSPDAHPDAHLDAPKKSCKSDKYDSPDAHPDAHLDAYHKAYPDAHPDAHLDAPKKSCKSDKYDSPDAHPDAHLDAYHKAYPDAHPDAHLDATIKEYIESKDNIYNISSSRSEDDYSDKMSEEQSPKIDLSKFIQFFNGEMDAANALIPKIRTIAGVRRKHILARCREFGKEALVEMVKKAARSDFLNGKNQRGWIANFSWLILPNNFPKVIEGNYDNKQNKIQDNVSDRQKSENKRRGSDVTATSAQDYEGAF